MTTARVYLFAGTRPEAVKLAPLPAALTALGFTPVIVDVGQQPGRVDEALRAFGLLADRRLRVDRRDGGLNELLSLVVDAADHLLAEERPDAVIVQGDTSTALGVALAASMRQIPVIHLEAGLRSGNRHAPFPEETNRVLLAGLADLHLAPTTRAACALLREGHDRDRIVISGNTIVDAVTAILTRMPAAQRHVPIVDGRLLSVTVHRREAWGGGVAEVCRAVRTVVGMTPDLHAVVVAHPNPVVAADVRDRLARVPRCEVWDPLPYEQMLVLLAKSDVALTDSGGIQEEAPTLRVPVVVARTVTERPEGVEAGWATLAGLRHDALAASVLDRLRRPSLPEQVDNPYGDGRAAERAAQAIAWLLRGEARPDDWRPSSTHPDGLAAAERACSGELRGSARLRAHRHGDLAEYAAP